jgi:hypothetical protein
MGPSACPEFDRRIKLSQGKRADFARLTRTNGLDPAMTERLAPAVNSYRSAGVLMTSL